MDDEELVTGIKLKRRKEKERRSGWPLPSGEKTTFVFTVTGRRRRFVQVSLNMLRFIP
jgi:hypothetical protein